MNIFKNTRKAVVTAISEKANLVVGRAMYKLAGERLVEGLLIQAVTWQDQFAHVYQDALTQGKLGCMAGIYYLADSEIGYNAACDLYGRLIVGDKIQDMGQRILLPLLAHELGHYAMGHQTDAKACAIRNLERSLYSRPDEEFEADAFAAYVTGDKRGVVWMLRTIQALQDSAKSRAEFDLRIAQLEATDMAMIAEIMQSRIEVMQARREELLALKPTADATQALHIAAELDAISIATVLIDRAPDAETI